MLLTENREQLSACKAGHDCFLIAASLDSCNKLAETYPEAFWNGWHMAHHMHLIELKAEKKEV